MASAPSFLHNNLRSVRAVSWFQWLLPALLALIAAAFVLPELGGSHHYTGIDLSIRFFRTPEGIRCLPSDNMLAPCGGTAREPPPTWELLESTSLTVWHWFPSNWHGESASVLISSWHLHPGESDGLARAALDCLEQLEPPCRSDRADLAINALRHGERGSFENVERYGLSRPTPQRAAINAGVGLLVILPVAAYLMLTVYRVVIRVRGIGPGG